MRKRKYFISLWLALFCLICYSCRDYMLDDLSDENKYPISFSIDDAKVFFENNATDLAPLSFQEKSISRSTPSSGPEIHPEWEKSMTSGHEGVTLIEIPLRSSSMVYSIENIYKNGVKVSNFSSVSERRLIVAKRADGEIDMFIVTIVPKCQDSQEDINKTLRDFRYLGGGSFSGKVFCSTLDGRFVKAFGYKNGKMNGTLNTRVRNAEGKQNDNNIDSDYSHFQILEASPGLSRYSSSESGGSTGNKCIHGYLYSVCPFNCILPGGEIPGVDVVVCRYCHSSDGCVCPKCFWCGKKERECRCTVCIKCKKKMQECTCYMYPDPTDPVNPPPGGGGSGGTGTGTSSQKQASTITNAAKNAVAAIIKTYGTTVASCNRGVQNAFNQIYTTHELDNKRANDIVDYWANHPEKWESIKMSEAQDLANKGWFVVAGWKSAPGKSGHVVVIVPGTEQAGWGGKVPVAMDTGCEMRSESQKLSSSFGKDKKDNVKFYKYK